MTDQQNRRQGLALIGLRGTGKTTVGRILAERLGRPFADADHELEAWSGLSIPKIFKEQGEPAFRDLEEQTLETLTQNPNLVLATGGGAILRPTNRARLRAFGQVIWLTADPSQLAERLLANPRGLANRPSLTTAGTIDELSEVLQARSALYEEVADLTVETGGRTTRQVVDHILDRLRALVPTSG